MLPRHAILFGAAVIAVAVGNGHGARAQGNLEAQYTVTLAGVPLGRGAWLVEINEDQFRLAASGGTAGLVKVFASGHGTSAATGTLSGGQPTASSYASSIVADKRTDDVRMVLNGGIVKEYITDPPILPNPDRVPVTDAHRKGVTDPMTASLMRVPGTGDTFVPAACQRTLPIFDGRMRYDLQLAYKRLDKVTSDKGYQGTVVVCSVQFAPIAGHVPDRAAIKYLVQLRDMEIWLAPVAGTRFMVPYRISIPTPIGLGVLQANQFVSVPQPSRPTTTNARTQ